VRIRAAPGERWGRICVATNEAPSIGWVLVSIQAKAKGPCHQEAGTKRPRKNYKDKRTEIRIIRIDIIRHDTR